ncbi:AAA family ATPase [Paraliomyxa miuraensis]|uniref:AAA family ATPase n=1 Tax=Paraliomyxa miuraensis TaxID=376150 RepID=UPI002258EB67|nr:ATP-binding protein [Paraliomyxa miuraensis]MCX4243526.1 AAA family ATPase [Paraliomyxa miuraensis]
MLKRIHVHNYRTLVHFEWSLPSSCVLVGDNGAGKSALFEALWIARDVIVHGKRIDELGFPATRTAWLDEPSQVIALELEHDGEHFEYQLEARLELSDPHDRSRCSIIEQLSSAGDLLYEAIGGAVKLHGGQSSATIPFDRRRSFLAAIEPGPGNRKLVAFRDAIASMWMFKPDPLRIGGVASRETTWIERDLGNFANWYRTKVQEDFAAATRLREDLIQVLPGFYQLRLESISAETRDLRIRFDFGGKTHEVSWDGLSEGQRLLIALYGVLRFALEHASLIGLDEIENYVAPAEIQPWLRAVVDAALEGDRQLLVISHHPESIDYLAADAAWRMWRDPATGCSRIAKLEPDLDAGETAYDLAKQRVDDE